jgi:hypothetical protein
MCKNWLCHWLGLTLIENDRCGGDVYLSSGGNKYSDTTGGFGLCIHGKSRTRGRKGASLHLFASSARVHLPASSLQCTRRAFSSLYPLGIHSQNIISLCSLAVVPPLTYLCHSPFNWGSVSGIVLAFIVHCRRGCQ